MKPVESSNIWSIGYDAEQNCMEIEFHDGRVYRYDCVPPEIHDGLVEAESIGQFFHGNVRDKYRSTRVDPDRNGDPA